MQQADPTKPLEIRSDSNYLVEGMNSWIKKWGTDKSKWDRVVNRDLFKQLQQLRDEREGTTSFIHVPAHSGIPGNEEADRLAVEGASTSKTK
jgi:ribonuclease HI